LISEVKIKNWKSHKDSSFEFSDGVNAIIGIMGSGKSSVMDAICFAFFGTYPALNQRKLKIDDLIRNKPKQEISSELYVKFLVGNDEYSVLRLLERGKGTTNSRLEKNGERIEGPNAQRVTEYIEKILKINYELFVRAVYSEQNQIDYFLSIPKGKRKDKIDHLLGMDKFEHARKNLSSVSSSLLLEARSKKEGASSIFDVMDVDTLERLGKDVQRSDAEIAELEKELETVKQKAVEAERKVQELEENQKLASEISSKIERLSGKEETLKKELGESINERSREEIEEALEENQGKMKALAEIKLSVEKLLLEKAGLSATVDILNSELRLIKNEIKETPISVESLEELKSLGTAAFKRTEEESNLKESVSVLVQEFSEMRKIEEVQELLSELEKQENKLRVETDYARHFLENVEESDNCPLCKAEISEKTKEGIETEHSTKLGNFENSLSKIKEEHRQLTLEFDVLSKKKNELEKLKAMREEIEEAKESKLKILEIHFIKKKDLERAIGKTDLTLGELENNLKASRKSLEKNGAEKIEEEIKILETALKNINLIEELREISAEIIKLNEELRKLGFSREIYKLAREERQKLFITVERLSASAGAMKQVLLQKKIQIESLEKKKNLQKDQLTEAEKLAEITDALELYKIALKKTQESLRKEFIIVVNDVMDDIWGTIYPYHDISGARLFIEDGDYVLQVKTSTGWTEVEGKISGGERSVAILALRIAFSLALAPTLSWLILDEPTHNLDTNATNELATALRERLPKLIDQIFLITHEESLESAVTTYLYKLERDKNVDSATEVTMATSPVENGNH
tara:strand:- start:40438 stop:42876 length:2439 start_codon:yes stop_codon:yes gene_type:complete